MEVVVFNKLVLEATYMSTSVAIKYYNRMGSKLHGFDAIKWEKDQMKHMTDGVNAKFSQNPKLKQLLLNTGG